MFHYRANCASDATPFPCLPCHHRAYRAIAVPAVHSCTVGTAVPLLFTCARTGRCQRVGRSSRPSRNPTQIPPSRPRLHQRSQALRRGLVKDRLRGNTVKIETGQRRRQWPCGDIHRSRSRRGLSERWRVRLRMKEE